MDVQVQGERVFRVFLQHRLQRGDDGLGPRLRLAVGRRRCPRPQVHHRLGVQGTDVAVVGELSHTARIALA